MAGTEESAHFLSGKRILVAGAGMAGLSFALSMHKHFTGHHPSLPPPKVIIYDRDTQAASIGRQGYSISIVGDTADGGLHTLSQLGLLEEILRQAILGVGDKGSFKLWTENWKEMISVKLRPYGNLPTAVIRIARKDLRQILLDACLNTSTEIRWGKSCIGVNKLGENMTQVQVLDHDTNEVLEEEFDLLIAADGASSKLRAQIRVDDELEYAGAVQMGGIARYPEGLPPPVDVNWGGILSGRGVFVFFSPVSKTEVVWGLSIKEEEPSERFDSEDSSQVALMLTRAKEFGKDIGPPFPEILRRTEASTTLLLPARDKRPFDNHETLKTWGPVVFIGDANHAVSPFGGNGANLALRDGWDLAEQLCRGQNLVHSIQEYDKRSSPRALATLKSSHQRITMGHSTGLQYWGYRLLFTIGGTMLWIMGRS